MEYVSALRALLGTRVTGLGSAPFLAVFVPPVVLALAAAFGGPWLALPPVVLFVAVPVLDQLLPVNRDNRSGARWTRALPWAFLPAHVAALGVALWTIGRGSLPVGEAVCLALGAGTATAAAINVAHEAMHRSGRAEQALGAVLMATATYTHFCVEHVQGHHKRVGTPDDPASARLGESLYAFLPRSLWGGLVSAWRIERARAGVGMQNRMLRYGVGQVVLLAAVLLAFGPLALAGFLLQSAVAVLMLETINYVEHYGLSRAETAPGRFERVRPDHSWNSSHRVSNWILLNLARHSDHHAFAARPFTDLRHYDDVPQLPAGYSAMLILATVPPLWSRVMDRRVLALRQAPSV
ncbi:MAG: alkane 1-monooxygenase [Myxococcales bacterium]|nr:alkane 1-monooxygenase [Myxococcales bacterium]